MISLKKESESRMIRRRPQIGSQWLEEGFKVFNFRYPDFTRAYRSARNRVRASGISRSCIFITLPKNWN